MIEQVTIVGMGALGILYGDRLSRYLGADHVRFLAAGERLERYRREGAWCNGKKCAFQFSDGTDGESVRKQKNSEKTLENPQIICYAN